MFQTKAVESTNTRFMFNDLFFENCAVYVITCKNKLQLEKPQITVSYGTCALHAR